MAVQWRNPWLAGHEETSVLVFQEDDLTSYPENTNDNLTWKTNPKETKVEAFEDVPWESKIKDRPTGVLFKWVEDSNVWNAKIIKEYWLSYRDHIYYNNKYDLKIVS